MAEEKNYESVPGFGEETVNTGRDPVICANCRYSMNAVFSDGRFCGLHKDTHPDYWFCADGVARHE